MKPQATPKISTACTFRAHGGPEKTRPTAIVHAHRLLDVNSRAEWFDDIDASRIGKRANYGEITMGVNFMPTASVNFRPEVRWDGADSPVFGPTTASHLESHQWTYAVEMLLKF
jgi:hypothetical protein